MLNTSRLRRRSRITGLVLAAVSLAWTAISLEATDIDTIRTRIHDNFVGKTDKSEASMFLSTLRADGSWADLNYGDRDPSRWTPIIHLRRLRGMGAAYYDPDHTLHGSADALDAISRGLTFWYGRDASSSNWWHREVNTPQELGAILVMCQNDLPTEVLTSGTAELFPGSNSWSGQNRIYTSFSGVYQAILQNDLTYLNRQFERIRAQATYKVGQGRTNVSNNDSKEGIRREHSFYQHGPALYNGFYGAHFMMDMPFWMAMSQGLSFGFTDAEKVVIQDHMLDGQQWMNRGGTLDPNTVNRKISHDNYDYVTRRYHDPVVDGLEYLRALDLPRASEIEAFYLHMSAGGPSQIAGNRAFWKTDFMVQAGAGYQVSTKLWSYHNEGTETLNGDNLQGRFLPLGGTFLLLDGDEYLDIFPVWDWGRVPGTTTLHRDPGNTSPGTLGTQKFAGGVSNGTEGAMAYDHSFDSVSARKSWFYFADAYVMLGAGITGGNGNLPVNTTLNQCNLNGDPTLSASGTQASVDTGESTPAGLEWVFHDGVGYLFPQGGTVTVARKPQSGSWFEINDSLPSTTLTKDILSLWFDHGTAPSNAKYAAIIVPGRTDSEFESFRSSSPIEILSNTAELQSVRHATRQLTQAAFFIPGTLTTARGMSLSASHPCLLMVDESVSPASVTVADPTQKLASLNIGITEPGQSPRTLEFSLPTGDDAGRSADEPAAPGTADPPLNATAINWSNQTVGGQATYLTDGILADDSQRWATDRGFPQWVELDLGFNQSLTGTELYTYLTRAYRFKVEVKPEGGAYSQVVDRTANVDSGPIKDSFAPITGRYVKVTLTGATGYTGPWTSLYEIRVFGTPLLSPYDEWRAEVSWGEIPLSLRGFANDPDSDGRVNGLERALGSNPTLADPTTGIRIATDHEPDGGVTFKLSYEKAAADLSYTVLTCGDLVSWNNQGVSAEQLDPESGLYFRTWTAPSSVDAAFIRLIVQ